MFMTRSALQDICKEHKLYRTPNLNDKLYCNFKGFTNIANLEEYTSLRALFLEGNALESLNGLPRLPELRCLYVQQNCIWEISDLEGLDNLDTLNISNNHIRKLDRLSCCPKLSTLICTNNKLETLESVQHLAECKNIHTLDVQNNIISSPEVLEVFKQMPNLKCLYLKGNPVVSNIKNYRKTIISALTELTYLDDRPVFENERRTVTAWAKGGLEAEREERAAIKKEEEDRDRRNFEFMQQIRREGWRKRREKLGLSEGDTDPALEELSDDEYQFLEEPEELVQARRRLAMYTPRPGEEEPSDLTAARQALLQEGKVMQQGSWSQGEETPDDSTAYLDSVRQAQAELDMVGSKGVGLSLAPDSELVDDTQDKARAAPASPHTSRKAAIHLPDSVSDVTPAEDHSMPALEVADDVDLTELD